MVDLDQEAYLPQGLEKYSSSLDFEGGLLLG